MKDLSELKLDLTPGVLRNAAEKEERNRREKKNDSTVTFSDESQKKDETGKVKF